MADAGFIYSYKGAVYPLSNVAAHLGDVKPLIDLCASRIIQDSTMTKRVLRVAPTDLCFNLMRAALWRANDRAIEVLVSLWPFSALSLRKFAPNLFSSTATLYNGVELGKRTRLGMKWTTCLAHTFVECLKRRDPTKLRFLDLTGYPTAEVVINYLSSHVMLVRNENRQQHVIRMYNQISTNLPESERNSYQLDHTIPANTYIIKLDAFVQTRDTHMDLCRALKISKTEESTFGLQVNKLDLTCLGTPQVAVLLEQVIPQQLCGLRLQYNALTNMSMTILGPVISQFINLSSLDLSSNSIDLYAHDVACQCMAEMLKALPYLTRLDLSSNWIKTKLRAILTGIPQPLIYLKLCGCGLQACDIQYLCDSHHAIALEELDLSENNLARDFEIFTKLIRGIAGNLILLELEDCEFNEDHTRQLMQFAPDLEKLKFWNLSRNTFSISCQVEMAKCFVRMTELEAVKVTFPIDVFTSIVEEDIDEEKSKFSLMILNVIRQLSARPGCRFVRWIHSQ